MSEKLVSIIMPAYNEEEFILESIMSVKYQTYKNWELIIVDDCSTDNTARIIIDAGVEDNRIKYIKMDENSGAALSRNKGVDKALGSFIAFLDSDDLWFSNKLEVQVNFMIENNYLFTSTAYNKIDTYGENLNQIVNAPIKQNYNSLLKRCPGNSTVIYNSEELGKFKIPNIKKRNDYVMWLQVIKKSKQLFGLDTVLSSHRIVTGSLSSNKFDLVKYHWHVYRNIEKLGLLKTMYLIFYWGFATVFRLR